MVLKKQKILAAISCVAALMMTTTYSLYIYASSIEEVREQKTEAEAEAARISDAKRKLDETIGTLTSDLQKVSGRICELEDAIAENEAAMERAQKKLQTATEKAGEQYESMKLRIRYMYENSRTGTLSMILEAENFADFLNRVNYVADLSVYDRDKLEAYEDTMRQIAAAKDELQERQEKLEDQRQQLADRETELNADIEKSRSQLASAENEEAAQQRRVEALADKIAAMEEYERELEKKKAREASRKQQAHEEKEKPAQEKSAQEEQGTGTQSNGSDSGGQDSSRHSSSDETLLAALIYCEAGGESYSGQLAVGTVVMNRIASSSFPDTMTGVIYQSGQFTPAASGKLALALENGLATDSCKRAAREVLSGTRTGSWLFFCMNYGTIDGTVIDHQVFY